MKKILIALKSMNIGGVEKSLLSLFDTIDPKQYEVDVLLLENNGGFLDRIPNRVNVIFCKEYANIKDEVNQPPFRVIMNHIKRGRIWRAFGLGYAYLLTKLKKDNSHYYKVVFKNIPRLEKKYDIAISYTSIISYLSWYVNYHVDADKYIGWIHFDVKNLQMDRKLTLKLHQNMEKIYVVSQVAKESFEEIFPELKCKCELRYNILDKKKVLSMSEENIESIRIPNHTTIVTLGRLTTEKGQDIVPEVAYQLRNKGYKFKWYLVGDGNLRGKIEKQIEKLELQDCLVLLGTKPNPYPYLKQTDVYVQTSIHEGYCITIAEAKVFELPIVSTEFAGAHEQLDGRADCYVVQRDVEEMTNAIEFILSKREI